MRYLRFYLANISVRCSAWQLSSAWTADATELLLDVHAEHL